MPRLKIILQSKIFIIISLIFILSYIIIFTKLIKYESKYDINNDYLKGKIVLKKIDGDKLSLTIKGIEKVVVTYYFNSQEEKEDLEQKLQLGQLVLLHGKFSLPSNNTIPNTFNYKKYLYNKKIYVMFNASKIEVLNSKVNFFYKIKNNINKKISNSKCSSYLEAFILGNNDYIDNQIYKIYQKNGVTHLFAVSGMHISFLVLFLTFILKKLNLKEKGINLFISVFLIFYIFLVGFSASVLRASIFYIFNLLNKKLNINFKFTYF